MRVRMSVLLVTALAVGAAIVPGGSAVAAAARTVSVGSAAVVEGDTGTRTVKIPVTLSSPSPTPITVGYQVVAPNASSTVPAASTDFKPVTGSLKFNVNATSGLTPVMLNITVTVLADRVAEPTEAFDAPELPPT